MNNSSIPNQLATALQIRSWMIATAESCTGGMIAARCTDLIGSSLWFERGFVTYSNAAKTELLGVPATLIVQYGAVSEAVACAMAQGAMQRAPVQASVAVTGIAGPSGGSADKPVGTVCLAWCVEGAVNSERVVFPGDRAQIREATVQYALQGLLSRLK